MDDFEAQKKLAIQMIEEAKQNKNYEPVLDIPLQQELKNDSTELFADLP